MNTAIRFANTHDAAALDRLAQLDSSVVPAAPQLIAEEDGRIVAALSARDGAAIADPFTYSADSLELLRRQRPPARHDAARAWPPRDAAARLIMWQSGQGSAKPTAGPPLSERPRQSAPAHRPRCRSAVRDGAPPGTWNLDHAAGRTATSGSAWPRSTSPAGRTTKRPPRRSCPDPGAARRGPGQPRGRDHRSGRGRAAGRAHRLPDPLRRRGHVDVAHAQVRQRVDDRVPDRRRRADRARLADALRPERVARRRRLARSVSKFGRSPALGIA